MDERWRPILSALPPDPIRAHTALHAPLSPSSSSSLLSQGGLGGQRGDTFSPLRSNSRNKQPMLFKVDETAAQMYEGVARAEAHSRRLRKPRSQGQEMMSFTKAGTPEWLFAAASLPR
mmetsp:Transcript_37473/g.55013  ORF Transcript_37473/g.55013 Transcript_37473/m.55013 type:complete len:118 (-) Transcript_37473:907-1260(-)